MCRGGHRGSQQAARAEPCPGAGTVPAAVPARCRLPPSPHVMVSPRWGHPRWPGVIRAPGPPSALGTAGGGPGRVSVPCAGDVPAERGQGEECPGGDGIRGVCQSRDEIQGASGLAHGGALVHVPCRGWQAAGGPGGSGDSPGSWALGLCSAPSAADRARDGFLLLEGPAEPS